MPHQCLNCNAIYDDNSDVILKGCPRCGHKLFLYIKKVPKEEKIELSKEEKEKVEEEVKKIISNDIDKPVILYLENIRSKGEGKYEIDINQLLKKDKPIIYKVQEGTYFIDLTFNFDKNREL